jgi:uncharacterized membrane protein
MSAIAFLDPFREFRMSNAHGHRDDVKRAGNVFVPYILYLAGIIGSSVILVVAAISAVKDTVQSSDWQKALFAFIFWMAATIVIATLVALYIQLRRTRGGRSIGWTLLLRSFRLRQAHLPRPT